ncbi:MAG TPA: hypothetical protein ENG66_04440 [Thermococcus sp.]|nr:hypothetical protein [Thermococcus sp.]
MSLYNEVTTLAKEIAKYGMKKDQLNNLKKTALSCDDGEIVDKLRLLIERQVSRSIIGLNVGNVLSSLIDKNKDNPKLLREIFLYLPEKVLFEVIKPIMRYMSSVKDIKGAEFLVKGIRWDSKSRCWYIKLSVLTKLHLNNRKLRELEYKFKNILCQEKIQAKVKVFRGDPGV